MPRAVPIIAALIAISTAVVHAGEDEGKKQRRAERRLLNLEARANRTPKAGAADELGDFLLRETHRLLERSRSHPPASYKFERLLEAFDDLLDAREDLVDARQNDGTGRNDSKKTEEDNRADTARRLERAYFRVQQGEYFGRLSGDSNASEHILGSRQLYQKARAAYDRREYRRANKLASASSELVNVLENLAQAAVRRPEPPVLK